MGMFGKRSQAYETTGLERPGLGGKILNQIGMNLLGVDFEGQRLAQALAKKQGAFLNDLEGQLGPQYATGDAPTVGEGGNASEWEYQAPVRTGNGLSIKSPDLPRLALEAQRLGVPMAGLLDVLKAQKLDLKETNGRVWDPSDAGNRERFIPKLGEGQTMGLNGNVLNLPGYVDSTAELEGAKTGAQEKSKAQLDVIEVDMGDGSKQQVPRDVAVKLIMQSLAGAGGGEGSGGGIGRSRTPEQQALATGRAGNTVKQEGMVGDATVQAGLDLPKARDQAMNTLGVLDKIRTHPSLPDRTGNSTLLPALRPQDVDFDAMVSQIGGGAFLEAIQALKGTGQITEIEGKKATDAIARMQNQRQSRAGFLTAMKDYEDIVRKGLTRTERRAGGPQGGAPSASRWTPEAARAELARRRLAQGR